MSGKVDIIFWEIETKLQKLFESKFSERKLLRKWFWSYLGVKKECSDHLKIVFLSSKVETVFWESKAKPSKTI